MIECGAFLVTWYIISYFVNGSKLFQRMMHRKRGWTLWKVWFYTNDVQFILLFRHNEFFIMGKRFSDEPADKANERLRQMEEARKETPDEKVFKGAPDQAKKAARDVKPKKAKRKSTKKNK